MADKNRNGVDDKIDAEREAAKKKYAGLKPTTGAYGSTDPNKPRVSNVMNPGAQGSTYAIHGGGAVGPSLGALPPGTYIQKDPQAAQLPSPQPFSAAWRNALTGGPRQSAAPVEEKEKTLADYLQQALGLLGGAGIGGGVNYDPQRATARQQAGEADARLEAMYRQLRGSIDADAPVLQQGFQQAIDSTAQNAQNAQAQAQAASDNATARNDQVLANLGIQQAAGNQIQEGRDLGTQTAGNIAAMAAKGQAAGDRLVSNQATALAHNTNIGNAAGLEGNLQRAANQSRLASLLADIDMQEQQANQSAGANGFSQQLSLANSLLDFDRYNQERQDNLQQSAISAANDRYAAELKNQGAQLPDLGTFLQAMGMSPEDLRNKPRETASLLDVLRKFSITQ